MMQPQIFQNSNVSNQSHHICYHQKQQHSSLGGVEKRAWFCLKENALALPFLMVEVNIVDKLRGI